LRTITESGEHVQNRQIVPFLSPPPLYERTSTGDLLRRHSVPPAVLRALQSWDLLPSSVRDEVEALLDKALRAEKNPWIDVNPVLPDRFGVPSKTEKPLRAATDPPTDD
jgi:hypothetical protein